MSRRTRVIIILALGAWSLSGVPDRVAEQREAVANLAADRGAASAGGAVLAAMADLRSGMPGEFRWQIAGGPCERAPAVGYWSAIESARQDRACRAAAMVGPGDTTPHLLAVEGDLYLVLPDPQPVQALTAPAAPEAPVPPSTDGAVAPAPPVPPAAPAPPVPPSADATIDAAIDAAIDVTIDGVVGGVVDGVVERAVERAAEEAATPIPPKATPIQTSSESRTVKLRIDSLEDLERLAEMEPLPGLDPDMIVETPAQFGRLAGLVVAGIAAEIERQSLDASVPTLMVLPRPSGSVVAWWPPIQAQVENATGIPLQVGGEPPRARAVLPGHRLAGVPVWSLPSPATEAAFDLFDGTAVLWLAFLGALLVREYWGFRREEAGERDRQSSRDAILQRLSHELRTPAASVRSLVDALHHPATSEAERVQFLDLVRSEAERLSVGIDRLLQAARGDARVAVDRVDLDLAEWADAVVARWQARLPGVRVSGPRPSPAHADPERLDEAVDALLDNARKYGGLNVTLTVAPGEFAVEDDGEGIPSRDRARVQQKFERVEGRVNDPGGHGLGLWAVGEVARAHGGRLTIEGGNRFVVTLR